VANLACAIAGEIGLPKETIEGIQMAGAIHDLGKISVPTEILSKPTRLTDIEFKLIQTHSEAAYNILKEIEFEWPVAEIVVQHHEKLNGKGYPRGLKGDQICQEARILCVADVVEAIASDRPYRPGLGIDIALGEISKNKGIFYDPDAVDACLRLISELGVDIFNLNEHTPK
jgi:HD-GYP domain-containing protein (c-di-GMP phosphodiesterase class II)